MGEQSNLFPINGHIYCYRMKRYSLSSKYYLAVRNFLVGEAKLNRRPGGCVCLMVRRTRRRLITVFGESGCGGEWKILLNEKSD